VLEVNGVDASFAVESPTRMVGFLTPDDYGPGQLTLVAKNQGVPDSAPFLLTIAA
jgi:hypothetical protein